MKLSEKRSRAFDYAAKHFGLRPQGEDWETVQPWLDGAPVKLSPELDELVVLLTELELAGENNVDLAHLREGARLLREALGANPEPHMATWFAADAELRERATVVAAIDKAASYLLQMRDLALEKDYSELLHHAGHISAELSIVESTIKAKRE